MNKHFLKTPNNFPKSTTYTLIIFLIKHKAYPTLCFWCSYLQKTGLLQPSWPSPPTTLWSQRNSSSPRTWFHSRPCSSTIQELWRWRERLSRISLSIFVTFSPSGKTATANSVFGLVVVSGIFALRQSILVWVKSVLRQTRCILLGSLWFRTSSYGNTWGIISHLLQVEDKANQLFGFFEIGET